jgi:hypothetical protein
MLGPSHRTAGLLAAGALVVGWLSASLVVPPSAISQSRAAAPSAPRLPDIPSVALGAVMSPHQRPNTGRNPFAFAGADRRGTTGAADDPPGTDTAAEPGDAPAANAPGDAAPAWRIAGIAFDAGTGHTAVVVGDGNVHLLRVGDQFAGGEVLEITATQLTLKPAAGEPLVLRLP